MEILFHINELDAEDPVASVDPINEDKVRAVLEFEDESASFSMVNIGPGADFFVILSTILLVKDFVMLAPSVLEGLDSWKRLIGKIKRWINKKELISGDEEFAKLLAVDYLMSHYQYEKHCLVDSHTIATCDFSSMIFNQDGELPKRPHNYYIQTYQLNDGRIIVLGIKSSGEVNLIKAFEHNPYGLLEIEEDKPDTFYEPVK